MNTHDRALETTLTEYAPLDAASVKRAVVLAILLPYFGMAVGLGWMIHAGHRSAKGVKVLIIAFVSLVVWILVVVGLTYAAGSSVQDEFEDISDNSLTKECSDDPSDPELPRSAVLRLKDVNAEGRSLHSE